MRPTRHQTSEHSTSSTCLSTMNPCHLQVTTSFMNHLRVRTCMYARPKWAGGFKLLLQKLEIKTGPLGSYRKSGEILERIIFIRNALGHRFYKFRKVYHCRGDRNHFPDRFGYRLTPFYVRKNVKTLVLSGISKCPN